MKSANHHTNTRVAAHRAITLSNQAATNDNWDDPTYATAAAHF